MIMKTKEDVINDLKDLFDLKDGKNEFGSRNIDHKFYISKQQHERENVIKIVNDYFGIDNKTDSFAMLRSITFFYTIIEIYKK